MPTRGAAEKMKEAGDRAFRAHRTLQVTIVGVNAAMLLMLAAALCGALSPSPLATPAPQEGQAQ